MAADIVVFDRNTVGSARRGEMRNDLPGGGRRLVMTAQGIEHLWSMVRRFMTKESSVTRCPARSCGQATVSVIHRASQAEKPELQSPVLE